MTAALARWARRLGIALLVLVAAVTVAAAAYDAATAGGKPPQALYPGPYTRVDGPPLTHAEIERWQRPFRVAGTAQALKGMLPHGIPGWTDADLRRVHGVPAAVAWGALDTVDAVSAGRRTAKLLHAPFVLLPRAGHLSMLDDPRGVVAAVARIPG